jgi:hypothetical protein
MLMHLNSFLDALVDLETYEGYPVLFLRAALYPLLIYYDYQCYQLWATSSLFGFSFLKLGLAITTPFLK